MDLTSEHFGLIHEIMNYVTRGEGTYPVEDSPEGLFSVTVTFETDDVGEIKIYEDDLDNLAHAHVSFVLSDERRGTLYLSFAANYVYLLDIKKISLEPGDDIQSKIDEFAQSIRDEKPVLTQSKKNMWAKCLLYYISKGEGVHQPNFVDSMMGMTKVKVVWDLDASIRLLNKYAGSELQYMCGVAYKTESEDSAGSITFSANPLDITFSS